MCLPSETDSPFFVATHAQENLDTDKHMLGARNICQHLYDSAPSGRHGTMTYMCRALAHILQLPINNGDMDCVVS